jgi:hypothetical protein
MQSRLLLKREGSMKRRKIPSALERNTLDELDDGLRIRISVGADVEGESSKLHDSELPLEQLNSNCRFAKTCMSETS